MLTAALTACGTGAAGLGESTQAPREAEEDGQPSVSSADDGGDSGSAASGSAGADEPQADSSPTTTARVREVIDGDTFDVEPLAGAKLPARRVRLIGVDTPEVDGDPEPYGAEASAFTREQLTGTTIWLTKDVSETDRYGRALRFVWLSAPPAEPEQDEIREDMFNAVLVIQGYARASAYPPDVTYAELFSQFERQAREAGRGLWGLETDGDSASGDDSEPDDGAAAGYDGPYDPAGADRDCGDFDTRETAQAFYEAAGGPQADPHQLDEDDDGEACERSG